MTRAMQLLCETLSERLGTSGLDAGCLGVGGLAVRPCAWVRVAYWPHLLGSTVFQFYFHSSNKSWRQPIEDQYRGTC